MKAASVLLAMLVLLATACSSERSAIVEKTATAEIPTATKVATQVVATPVATECPTANPEEGAVREILMKGDLIGETVRLFLVGDCEIHQAISYELANRFNFENPEVSDYLQFPANPVRELKKWEDENNLPPGTLLYGIRTEVDLNISPSEAVCRILEPEGLRCD